MNHNSILCYSTTVNKRLQADTLNQTLKRLIRYNEILQVRLENGRYVPEPEADEEQRNKLLTIYDCAGSHADEVETLIRRIFENLADEMGCGRGASMRVALVNLDQGCDKLLLLLHRAIADQRGSVLILEDLYRIYEQLSNGREVALRPVSRTYLEFIKDAGAAKRAGLDGLSSTTQVTFDLGEYAIYNTNHRSEAEDRETIASNIVIDKDIKRRLYSWRLTAFDLTPVEALAGALLKSLVLAAEGTPVSIYINSDYRFADETLKYTAGAMTQTYMLPIDFARGRELLFNFRKSREILREIPLHDPRQDSPESGGQCSQEAGAGLRLRLNLEYLTDEPWLGGDEWQPEGFITTGKGRLSSNYSIEVIPVFLNNGIEIFVEYEDRVETRAIVEKLVAGLVPELEERLRYCEGYIDAKEFWVREFANTAAQAKVEVESAGHKETARARASWRRQVEKSVLDRALLNLKADKSPLLLAAFSVLASRWKGSEDVALLCALDQAGVSRVFPLRLKPAWDYSFELFLEEVKSKLGKAAALGQYALDILSEWESKHDRSYPVLDLGYVFKQPAIEKSLEPPATGSMASYPALNQSPYLVLEISESDGDLQICFVYETSRFGSEIIERFGAYLIAILGEVASDANIKLGEIEFEKDRKVNDMTSNLAEDAFNF